MSAFTAPTYDFTGIDFNASYFTSSDSGLTQNQANALYLLKKTADTATALETFTGGIVTDTISPTTVSTVMNIGATSTAGINIGTIAGRSAVIHIGDGDNNLAGSGVHVNNGLNTASNVQILNGSGSTGTITLGSSTSTTNVNSILTLAKPVVLGTVATVNTQLGFVVVETINATTIATSTTTNAFTTNVTLPSGIWLINYSLRLEPTAGTSVITSFFTYGKDNAGTPVIYGQSALTGSFSAVTGTGLCTNGSFVISSSGTTTYNIPMFVTYTGGTSFGVVKTGTNPSIITRTRVG